MFPLNVPNALTVIASDADAAWVQGLIYAMVTVTIVSGADYFLSFRRKLEEVSRARERVTRRRAET